MSNETIARRYASALADVVGSSAEIDTVKGELKMWEQLIASNSELHGLFGSPAIAHLKKVKVLDSLLDKTRPTKTTSNFLRVLLGNGRLTDLPDINERFASVLEERSGAVTAKVTSARELSDTEKNELKANLEKLTGKRVKPSFETDNNIIGGVVTQIGSTVYDGSVKTQLENLKQQLVNG